MDPNVKLIVSSGYLDILDISEYEEHEFTAVLAKPFSVTGLTRVVFELIEGSS